jgi:hypothetical protein
VQVIHIARDNDSVISTQEDIDTGSLQTFLKPRSFAQLEIPLPAPLPPVTPPRIHSPPPPAGPRRGQQQHFQPREFWRADAPLVPHRPATPPSPSPAPSSTLVPTLAESPRPSSPDPIAVDSDKESDDPLAMRAIEDLEHGLLSMAGSGWLPVSRKFTLTLRMAPGNG